MDINLFIYLLLLLLSFVDGSIVGYPAKTVGFYDTAVGSCLVDYYFLINTASGYASISSAPGDIDATPVSTDTNGNYLFKVSNMRFQIGTTTASVGYFYSQTSSAFYDASFTCLDTLSILGGNTMLSTKPSLIDRDSYVLYMKLDSTISLPTSGSCSVVPMTWACSFSGPVMNNTYEIRLSISDIINYVNSSQPYVQGFNTVNINIDQLFQDPIAAYVQIKSSLFYSSSYSYYTLVGTNTSTILGLENADNKKAMVLQPVMKGSDGVIYYFGDVSPNVTTYNLQDIQYTLQANNYYYFKKAASTTGTAFVDPYQNQILTTLLGSYTTLTVGTLSFSEVFINASQSVFFSNLPSNYKLVFPYPYGVVYNTASNSRNIRVDTLFSNYSQTVSGYIGTYSFDLPFSNSIVDTTPPSLDVSGIEYVFDNMFRLDFRVVDDISGFHKLIIKDSGSNVLFSINAADMTSLSGTYSSFLTFDGSYTDNILIFDVFDQALNYNTYSSGDITSTLIEKIPYNPVFDLAKFQITGVTFDSNSMNLDVSTSNTMYISIAENDYCSAFKSSMILYSSSYQRDKYLTTFEGQCINNTLIKFPFTLPTNLPSGVYNYQVQMPTELITSNLLNLKFPSSILTTNSALIDIFPPTISQTGVNFIQNGSNYIEITLNIQDQINGFSHGELLLTTDYDSIGRFFTFNSNNLQTGTALSGVYVMSFPYPTNEGFQQTYIISYVKLVDKNGHVSETYSPTSVITPFINSSPKNDIQMNTKTDSQAPTFSGYSIPPTLDVTNEQTFTFNFTLTDSGSGVSTRIMPTVYITEIWFDGPPLSFIPQSSISGISTIYTTTITVPRGFGMGSGIAISVYGLCDQALNCMGISTSNIGIIKTTYTFGPSVILSSKITNAGGILQIYGRDFTSHGDPTISIVYGNGQSESLPYYYLSPGKISVYSIKGTSDPFNITVRFADGNSTNTYTVTPLNIGAVPTTPPPVCSGTPLCSAPNGQCTSSGCVCVSPWTGSDCSSQQVSYEQPPVNTSTPTTAIHVTGSASSLLKSYISIVELREYSPTSDLLRTHPFASWNFTDISTNSTIEYLYTTLVTYDSSTAPPTQVNVSMRWFPEEETITFANQNMTMLPSTMKYKITLSSYPFSSKLNKLVLVMSASIQQDDQSDNLCSASEHGDTSDSQSEYVKLQVDKNSMYARFIKRAYIDYQIKTVSNNIIDSTQDPSNQQTNIGITLPYYSQSVIMDPDFSILLESTDASESENSVCDTSKKSKLSTQQIIGIAVGCGIFGVAIAAGVSYYFLKVRKSDKAMRKLTRKLQSADSTSNK